MRRWIAVLGTALVFGMALPASADRDWSYFDFQKKIRKLAVYHSDAAKIMCICQDGGSKHALAGWLESRRQTQTDGDWALQVRCLVPTYDTAAPYELDGYGFCEEFVLLNK